MRRAIETAYLVFREAPQFAEIEFIVMPTIRERLHTTCDVPESFSEVYEEWSPKFPEGHFDTSFMQESNYDEWYVTQLNDDSQ
jgi:hypothetical protein